MTYLPNVRGSKPRNRACRYQAETSYLRATGSKIVLVVVAIAMKTIVMRVSVGEHTVGYGTIVFRVVVVDDDYDMISR